MVRKAIFIIIFILLCSRLCYAGASITIEKSGISIDRWKPSGTSNVSDDFLGNGGIRIGDFSSLTYKPVYRFKVPKLGTIASLTMRIYGHEHNSGTNEGTTFRVGDEANWHTFPNGSILLYSFSPYNSVNDWISDNDSYTDSVEIEFNNTGGDDLEIYSLELTIEYANINEGNADLIGKYQLLCNLYSMLSTYNEKMGPQLKKIATDASAALVEEGFKKSIAVADSLSELNGFDISGPSAVDNWGAWLTSAQTIKSSVSSVWNLWESIVDLIDTIPSFNLPSFVGTLDQYGDEIVAHIENAIPKIGQLVTAWQKVVTDDGKIDSEDLTTLNEFLDGPNGVINSVLYIMTGAGGSSNGTLRFAQHISNYQDEFPNECDAYIQMLNPLQRTDESWRSHDGLLNDYYGLLKDPTFVTISDSEVSYTITATKGADGNISPIGNISVSEGGSQSFNAIPSNGYKVDYWELDGSIVQDGGSSYAVTNVQSDLSLEVTFKSAGSSGSESKTFTAGDHANIMSGAPNSSGSNATFIEVLRDSGNIAHGLVKFNVGSLPYGSTINNARLVLYCTYVEGDSDIYILPCGSDWSESSVSWNNDPATSGSAQTTSSSGIGPWIWETSGLTDIVQEWADNDSDNYGLYLIANGLGDRADFSSPLVSSDSRRPKLVVTYTPPLPSDLIVTDLHPEPAPSSNIFYVGDNIEWHVTVRNNGAGSAAESYVGYYLGSSPTDLSNRINRDTTSVLGSGQSDSDDDSYLFVEADQGEKYLIAKANYNSESDVGEDDESNNTFVFGPFIVEMPEPPVYIPNANLKAAIQAELGVTDPSATDMLALTYLEAYESNISDLTGLETATNLRSLELYGNQITDITPLANLTIGQEGLLLLGENQITDISPLANLTMGYFSVLDLSENQIRDISPLAMASLGQLQVLNLRNNLITEISSLENLTLSNDSILDLSYNQIKDISPLSTAGLDDLDALYLRYNLISDLSPLVNLTQLLALSTNSNPLSTFSVCEILPQIRVNNYAIESFSENNPPCNIFGSLQITLIPQGAVAGGAKWEWWSNYRGTGEAGLSSGQTINDLSIGGSYMIDFNSVPGWQIPDSQTITLIEGENKVTAVYIATSFLLTVDSSSASGVDISSSSGHDGTTRYTNTITSGTDVNLEAPLYVGDGGLRKRFTHWTGVPASNASTGPINSVLFQMNKAETLTAVYVADPVVGYTLSVNSSVVPRVPITSITEHNGITDYTKENLLPGTVVSLTAPATYGGKAFDGWTGATTSPSSIRTILLSMSGDKTVTANYATSKPIVTIVATDPEASESALGFNKGNFRVSRTGSTSSPLVVYVEKSGSADWHSDYTWDGNPANFLVIEPGLTYADYAIQAVYDTLPEGNETIIWALVNNSAYDIGSPSRSSIIIVDNEPETYPLSLATFGGPDGIHGSVYPDPDMDSYPEGTEVIITAVPDVGYQVAQWWWTGNVGETYNGLLNAKVIITEPTSATVSFEPITSNLYKLTITPPDNGSISVNPVSTTDNGMYEEGTLVTLTAEPDDGYYLAQWDGSVDDGVVKMTENRTISAIFEEIPPTLYRLTVETSANGTISVDTPSPTSDGMYADGEIVTLIAVSDSGYQVARWLGTDNAPDIGIKTTTVTMTTNKIVSVEFEEIPLDIIHIDKVSIKASKDRDNPEDSILIKGSLFSMTRSEFSQANKLNFEIGCYDDVGFFEVLRSFEIILSEELSNTGKYVYREKNGDNGDLLLKLDLDTHTISLKLKKSDLSLLKSPLGFNFYTDPAGVYGAPSVAYDSGPLRGPDNILGSSETDVVNGKKNIPILLLMGEEDALRVDKCKFKLGAKKPNSDSLKVQGGISVENDFVDLSNTAVTIHWGDFKDTIPAGRMVHVVGKNKFKYKKPRWSDGAISSFVIDLDKGTFKVKIKKAEIGDQGTSVVFGLEFGTFEKSNTVNLSAKNNTAFSYP